MGKSENISRWIQKPRNRSKRGDFSCFLKSAEGIEGSDHVQCPRSTADIVLIPQKPGLPMPMSLREAVSFPHRADHFVEEDIRRVLEHVGLKEFAHELVTPANRFYQRWQRVRQNPFISHSISYKYNAFGS